MTSTSGSLARGGGRDLGLSDLDVVKAVFAWPALYRLADAIPTPERSRGGAPRQYPNYMVLAFAMLAAHYGSARRAATELNHPTTWALVLTTVLEACPDEALRHLPQTAPSRTWYVKRRDGLVFDANSTLENLLDEFRDDAIRLHRQLRAGNGQKRGSLTHPATGDLIEADGKVLAAPYKAARGTTRRVTVTDPATGESRIENRQVRSDPDARTHRTGAGDVVVGNKYWIASARGERVHERVILDVAHVPDEKGCNASECDIATEGALRLAQSRVHAKAIVTDGVLRGVHIEKIQREGGIIVVSPVQAHKVDKSSGSRTEKEGPLTSVSVTHPDGHTSQLDLWYRGGRVCQKIVDGDAEVRLVPLKRLEVQRRQNKNGTHRFYVVYEVAHPHNGIPGKVSLSMDGHAENVRIIPPGDPDYKGLYGRRQDTEAINRSLDDHHHLRRARSVGARRQLFDVLAFAMRTNSITRELYLSGAPPAEAEAA